MSKQPQFLKLARQIASAGRDGIERRYEYGAQLLAARAGRQRLPKGFLADRVAEWERAGLPKVSEGELGRYMRLAEVYPTKAHRRHAHDAYGSWYEIVRQNFPEVTVDGIPSVDDVLNDIEDGPRPDLQEFEQIGMFPEMVKSIPLAESTLRHLVTYAEEMRSMTESYARRDRERLEHLRELTAATHGDLDVTYPEAVAALNAARLPTT